MASRNRGGLQRAGYRERSHTGRAQRQRFLIICEGTKTEPNYFSSFSAPKDVIDLEVLGLGLDPLQLVQEAISRQRQAAKGGLAYDQVWCVFDRDDWPKQCYKQAILLATEKKLQVAYSNEAFELWYLLHFDYHNTAISRDTYRARLTARLGFPYRKNHPEMYRLLQARQPTALRHATNLLAQYDPPDPANDNPSTTVHLLVQELNKHGRP